LIGLFLLILVSILLKKPKILIFGLFVLCLFSGTYYYLSTVKGLDRSGLEQFFGSELILTGCVIEEPDKQITKNKVIIYNQDLDAKILITAPVYPEIKYGNVLQIKGTLKEPAEFQGFDYKDYLKYQKIYFLMYYPEIEILEKTCGNPIKKTLIGFKNKLKNSLQKIAPVPISGFFEALIFGDENNVPEHWKQKLNISGTRHIAAVSGANITIMCMILLSVLLGLGFWRKHALWLSIILIFFYILMIGAPACAIRAGIMGALLLLAQNFGRIAKPERIMIFTLGFMLVSNPLLLRHDIGFQLSFLAFAGLFYLSPLFLKILKKLKVPKFLEIRMSLASTLSAQIFVLPILLYNFGQLSLVAPITNVLILPTITFLTISGFLFGFIGIFSQLLGQIISWPSQILMILIIKIIDIFSQFSWASKTINVSAFFVIISYGLLATFIYYLKKREKLWFLNY